MKLAIDECCYEGCDICIQVYLFRIKDINDHGAVVDMPPCKGDRRARGMPICGIFCDAMNHYNTDISVIYPPIGECRIAILEKTDARFPTIAAITEYYSVHNVELTITRAEICRMKIICLNCPESSIPGLCKHDVFPNNLCCKDDIGVVSRNDMLAKFDRSHIISINDNPIVCQTFSDVMDVFIANDRYHVVVLISEIDGTLIICDANVTHIAEMSTFDEVYMGPVWIGVGDGESDISYKIEQQECLDILAATCPSELSSLVM
jgi:succinyl-CoA synthetase alpha subunit